MKILQKKAMISCNFLPDNCEIVIVRKLGCNRTHLRYGLCGKTKINETWEGICLRCDYIKQHGLNLSAAEILPIETFYFDVLFEGELTQISTSSSLAKIIGDEIGPFHFVRRYKGAFSCYKESKFLP